jgi:CxxC motif-containing protein (DUF1111 family)
MRARPRPPRAASLLAGRARLSAALSCVLFQACSSADREALSPGEELPGGETTNQLLFGANSFLPPADNITREHERMFLTGNAFFNQSWTVAPSSNESRDGLGPLFNARACSTCHFKDGRGRPPLGDEEGFTGMLLRIGIDGRGPNGAPLPDPIYGDQLQPFGVEGVPGEGTPRVSYRAITGEYADGEPYELLEPTYAIDAPPHGALSPDLRVSPRVAPAMIGLGLLEAIGDDRLLSLADPDDADDDGVSGRVNRVWDVEANTVAIGRFGWKAEQPSVRQQSAGAFLGDMGITSSLFPEQECSPSELECQGAASGGEPEIDDDLLERVERYSQLLAVPARFEHGAEEVLRGKALFSEAGCTDCHTASHRTAEDAELEEVQDQLIWPYTDLLLHDMGDALGDDRASFEASGNEWRTPPLWGLGRYDVVNDHERLLHDGRARGVAEAILWHGGEGAAARDAFLQLSADERRDLVEFVESL